MHSTYNEKIIKRKKRRHLLLIFALLFFIFAIIGAVIYIMFFNSYFNVNEIKIRSTNSIPSEDVEKVVWDYLNEKSYGISRKNNIYTLNLKNVGNLIKNDFPRAAVVNVERSSSHRISISIQERGPVGLWCVVKSGRCFYYDATGFAFSEVTSSSGHLFVAIRDMRDRILNVKDNVESLDYIASLSEIKKVLQFGGISVDYFEISPENQNEFSVYTNEGWRIILLNDKYVKNQIDSLLAYLKERVTENERANLDYIDMRIQDSIILKPKEQ